MFMLKARADYNLACLAENEYPGRGVLIGKSRSGKHRIQVCWIMGRRPESQNRLYRVDRTRVYTDTFRENQPQPDALLLYNAMVEDAGCYVVGNANHTDAVLHLMRHGGSLQGTLEKYSYEPDKHGTARLTGVCSEASAGGQLSVVRKALWPYASPASCERHVYSYEELPQGFGLYLRTYEHDVSHGRLPPYRGEPEVLPLEGDTAYDVMMALWSNLYGEYRVAIAVKFIDIETGKSIIAETNRLFSETMAY